MTLISEEGMTGQMLTQNYWEMVDEQPQKRHVPWPQIFIITRESVRSQDLAKLDKRLSLTESERTSLISKIFDICIKQTH